MDKTDRILLQEIGSNFFIQEETLPKLKRYKIALVLIRILIACIGCFLLLYSYTFENDSLIQTLCIQFGIAFLILDGVVILINLTRRHPISVILTVLFIAIGFGIASFCSKKPTDSVLLSGAVALLLVVVINLIIGRWISAIENSVSTFQNKFDEARSKMKQANDELDFKYEAAKYFGIPVIFPGGISPDEDDTDE